MCRSAKRRCSTRPIRQRADPLVRRAWKVPTSWSSKARLKGVGMRWGRQNVNPMLVLRNAVCNRRWHETWAAAVAQRQALRTSLRQADSQQRLASAFWILVFWGAPVYRLSHPPVPASSSPTAASGELPAPRLGTGYSWRKPFLRRPPSTLELPAEACAKKGNAP